MSKGVLVEISRAQLRNILGHEVGAAKLDIARGVLQVLVCPPNADPIADTQPFPVMTLAQFKERFPSTLNG